MRICLEEIADFSLYEKSYGKGIFINPVIVDSHGENIREEGCLSIPGIRENITRSEIVTLQYETLSGEQKKEEFSGNIARVIQHEADHLSGILTIDRISPLKRSFLSSKLKKIAAIARRENSGELRLS